VEASTISCAKAGGVTVSQRRSGERENRMHARRSKARSRRSRNRYNPNDPRYSDAHGSSFFREAAKLIVPAAPYVDMAKIIVS
jgi:hypothetical protein